MRNCSGNCVMHRQIFYSQGFEYVKQYIGLITSKSGQTRWHTHDLILNIKQFTFDKHI